MTQSYTRVRAVVCEGQTDTQTHTRNCYVYLCIIYILYLVTNLSLWLQEINKLYLLTDARDQYTFRAVYDSREM